METSCFSPRKLFSPHFITPPDTLAVSDKRSSFCCVHHNLVYSHCFLQFFVFIRSPLEETTFLNNPVCQPFFVNQCSNGYFPKGIFSFGQFAGIIVLHCTALCDRYCFSVCFLFFVRMIFSYSLLVWTAQ